MITIQVTGYHDKPITHPISADFDDKGGTIGRAPENTLVLLDPERKISRVHASLSCVAGSFTIRDQGSMAPVVLNGQPLGNGREATVSPGDEIRIAGYVMSIPLARRRPKRARRPMQPAQRSRGVAPITAEAARRWSRQQQAPNSGRCRRRCERSQPLRRDSGNDFKIGSGDGSRERGRARGAVSPIRWPDRAAPSRRHWAAGPPDVAAVAYPRRCK
jgi:predicted component of type VI protein secretion system